MSGCCIKFSVDLCLLLWRISKKGPPLPSKSHSSVLQELALSQDEQWGGDSDSDQHVRGSYGNVLAMKNGGYSLGHSSGIQAKGFCLQQALVAHLIGLSDHVGQLGGHYLIPSRTKPSISFVK